MNQKFSRRQMFRGAAQAAVACGLGGIAPVAARAAAEKPAGKVQIGIATTGFTTLSNAELAKELSGAGIKLVQLFLTQTDSKFWKYNQRADVSSLTPERCKAIAATYRDAGISIHSIGVYSNMIHPDEAERKANLAYFEDMMKIGSYMDVHMFITEAGHYYDDKVPAPHVPLEFQDAVWPKMIATAKELDTLAARHDAKVLFEPFYRGFLASAKRLRMFLEELNSPRMRALLDAANLIEVNDVDEMFQQLTPWIDCIHAKDRKLHTDRGVAAGKGDLDYKKFVTLAAQRTPHAPLVLEYVGATDYRAALEHLRNTLRETGIEAT
ncbi:MAG: sugar phosphate isomerase/epimerase [Kiritimatiellaeota bacterium]|nr:sugar phosphate isomerase/epimerase [Kiritimatiellota bacterium]